MFFEERKVIKNWRQRSMTLFMTLSIDFKHRYKPFYKLVQVTWPFL